MASRLALSLNGYTNIERGKTKLSVERLEKIANIFGVEMTDLLNYGKTHSVTNSHTHSLNTYNLTVIGTASDNVLEL